VEGEISAAARRDAVMALPDAGIFFLRVEFRESTLSPVMFLLL
jgi:hypothetical protein